MAASCVCTSVVGLPASWPNVKTRSAGREHRKHESNCVTTKKPSMRPRPRIGDSMRSAMRLCAPRWQTPGITNPIAVLGESAVVAKTSNRVALVAPEVEARFDALNEAINAGDQRAARDFLALCEEHPILWQGLGDLQVQAELSWYALMVPGDTNRDLVHREMLKQHAAQRRKALSRDGSSPLETLLIDRIVSAWLQMTFAELKYTQALADPQCSSARSEMCQKRCALAQRQLLRATQALATMRRLVNLTQINVARTQNILVQTTS